MRSYSLSVLLIIFSFVAGSGCSANRAAYGRWEGYLPNGEIAFPDFDLSFQGISQGNHRQFGSTLRWGAIYKFKALKETETVPIEWSSGLGDIGPTAFEIGGRKYFLEMIMSDYLSDHAPEGAVAVWPEKEWERQRNPWWRLW